MNLAMRRTFCLFVAIIFVPLWLQGCNSLGFGQENPSTSKVRDMLELTQTSLQRTLEALQVTQSAMEVLPPGVCQVQSSQVVLESNPTQSQPALSTLTPETEQVSPTPSQNPDNPGPSVSQEDIIWYATHEMGDISEWEARGGFDSQGTGFYQIVDTHAHTGQFAISLTIDTLSRSETGAHAAYLFFWDQLPEDGYYYSAWYYIPSGTKPSDWWNIMQWKSTYDGNSDNSDPIFVLDADNHDTGGIALKLWNLPNKEDIRTGYTQDIVKIPFDKWFQVEAYYKRALDNTGQVIIWQDGVEIFNINGVNTVERDNTLYWSINSYAALIQPNPCTILVDDAVISKTRIGPDYKLYKTNN